MYLYLPTLSSVLYLTCCISVLFSRCSGFNFFPKFAQVFTTNNPESYFGYSLHLQAGNNINSARLIVGAPRENSTINGAHSTLYQPGRVFSCPLSGEGCKPFLLYLSGNVEEQTRDRIKYYHKKDGSWLGASVDGSDKSGGLLVTCAPRWINQRNLPHYYMQNGMCYYLKDSSNIERQAEMLIPLLEAAKQGYSRKDEPLYYYALGEAGMSLHLTKNQSDLLIGAPGTLQWQGMVIKYDYNTPNSREIFEKKVIPNPDLTQNIEDFSYFGYSVSSGRFLENSSEIWYVGGAPRGKNLLGQVVGFQYSTGRPELIIKFEMLGDQLGEYFGAAIAIGDVDGANADDIVVGAPMHFMGSKNDIGRVYVYTNNGKGIFKKSIIKGPEISEARFGSALSIVGDLNKDGFDDLVIGAPYYNKNQGVVYLYLGSKNGLTEKYSQIIHASEIDPQLRGFGNSFSKGLDIDNNNYNDLAVGAYLSGHAVILKSRPIANIIATLETANKQISIDTKNIEINACVTYTGKNVPNNLNIRIKITADMLYKRVFFNTNRGILWETVQEFQMNEQGCQKLPITIANTMLDFTQPIVFEMSYGILEKQEKGFCATCPILDKRVTNKTSLNILYEIGCGEDDICETDLNITANFVHFKPFLILGEEDSIDIQATIINKGEPSFATKFYAEIPSTTSFRKIPDVCQTLKNNLMICDVGNPLKGTMKKILTFPVEISNLGNTENLTIKMNVSNIGKEINPYDNVLTIEKSLKTQVEISVIGVTDPEQFVFVDEKQHLKQNSLLIVHDYTVQNLGPSPLDDLELTFLIPLRLATEEQNLIYVYQPEAPEMRCITRNPEGFFVDKPNGIPMLEAEEPVAAKVINSRTKRADTEEIPENLQVITMDNDVYTKMQRLIASNSRIPPNLPLNRTMSVICPDDEVESGYSCLEVKCFADVLKKMDKVTVKFKFLANLTLIDESRDDNDIVVFTTYVQPKSRHFNANITYTHTVLQGSLRPESPLKYIILGCSLGILIMCLIIYGLYRAGFFKRTDHEQLFNEKEENASQEMIQNESDE